MYMDNKKVFGFHRLALAAIFIIGNSVTELPKKGADEFSFLAFILSSAILFLIYTLSDTIFKLTLFSQKIFAKILSVILLSAVAVFSLFVAASVFLKTNNFISFVILPGTSKVFIALLLLSVTLYFIFKRQENVLKFSLISFVFICIVIIFFFLAASDRYDFQNIVILRLPSFFEIKTQIRPFLWNYIAPAIILPVYFRSVFKDRKIWMIGFGIFWGSIMAGLAFLMPLLLFGADFAGRLDYPFSSAVSTVTFGRLFTRLDGFSYFVFFACAIIKITVCAFVAFNSLKIINETIKNGTE